MIVHLFEHTMPIKKYSCPHISFTSTHDHTNTTLKMLRAPAASISNNVNGIVVEVEPFALGVDRITCFTVSAKQSK